MRWILAVALLLFSFSADAEYDGTGPGPGLTGNDTGGIIQWTPYVSRIYRRWAADHCAQWHRIATITSVHRRYGDYVAFTCDYDRRYDPGKTSWWWWHWPR
jgi:hypothetical protein